MAHFTPYQVSYIERGVRAGTSRKTMARYLDCSIKQLRNYIDRHCTDIPRPKRGDWDVLELGIIERNYATKTWAELLKLLPGRTRAGIKAQMIRMGLKRPETAPRNRRASFSVQAANSKETVEQFIKTVDRPCICCGVTFKSEGKFHRLCNECKKRDQGSVSECRVVA